MRPTRYTLRKFTAELVGSAALIVYVIMVSPNSWWIIAIFLLLIGITVYLFVSAVTNIVRHAILISSGVVLFLLLRLMGLTSPLYVLLLFACIGSLELAFRKR